MIKTTFIIFSLRMNIFKKRKLPDPTIEENKTRIEAIENDIFHVIEDNETLHEASYDLTDSYGTATINSNGTVTLTSSSISDAGIYAAKEFDLVRNNYTIIITLTQKPSDRVVIATFTEEKHLNNINRGAHWPNPTYSRGIHQVFQATSQSYKWLRTTEAPGTSINGTQHNNLNVGESLVINVIDGNFTYERLYGNGTKVPMGFSIVTLPVGKYYLGLHLQHYTGTDNLGFGIAYKETARFTPHSIINEIQEPYLPRLSTQYIDDPSPNDYQYPNVYCNYPTRFVISDSTITYRLHLPTVDPDKFHGDFVVYIKNLQNQSVTVVLPQNYRWSETYSTNDYTLSNHTTVAILINSYGMIGDWFKHTSSPYSSRLQLCHILHETTTVNNP